MLQFLQTGKVLYVLAGICGLGIISKLVTSGLYKRLIKETDNMVLTKNKNLRALKQRTENMFLLSHNLRNTNVYIEKQLYNFRFMNVSLEGWDNLAVQAMILCFLVGGLAAFGAYWYRCDSYYIVLYGAMGILSGLFLVFVDNSVNISMKRQQLADCLVDYMENSPHFNRPADKVFSSDPAERRPVSAKNVAESSKLRLREMGRNSLKVVQEADVREEQNSGTHVNLTEPVKAEKQKSQGKFTVLNRKKGRKGPMVRGVSERRTEQEAVGGSGISREGEYRIPSSQNLMQTHPAETMTNEEALRESVRGLKQSLDQIAASREQSKKEVSMAGSAEKNITDVPRRELSPEDVKFLGEILQEYFL